MAGFPLQSLQVDVSTTPAGGDGFGGAFDLSQFNRVSFLGSVTNLQAVNFGLTISLQAQGLDGSWQDAQVIATVGSGSLKIPPAAYNTPFTTGRIHWFVGSGSTGTFSLSTWGQE